MVKGNQSIPAGAVVAVGVTVTAANGVVFAGAGSHFVYDANANHIALTAVVVAEVADQTSRALNVANATTFATLFYRVTGSGVVECNPSRHTHTVVTVGNAVAATDWVKIEIACGGALYATALLRVTLIKLAELVRATISTALTTTLSRAGDIHTIKSST